MAKPPFLFDQRGKNFLIQRFTIVKINIEFQAVNMHDLSITETSPNHSIKKIILFNIN